MIRLANMDSLYYAFSKERKDLPQHEGGGIEVTIRGKACFYEFENEARGYVQKGELHSYLILGFNFKVWKAFKPYLDKFDSFGIEYTYLAKQGQSYFGYKYVEMEELPDIGGMIFFSVSTNKFTKKAGTQALYLLYVLIRAFSLRKGYYGLSNYTSLQSMFNAVVRYSNEESLSEDGGLSLATVFGINDYKLMNEIFKYDFKRQTEAFELIWRE